MSQENPTVTKPRLSVHVFRGLELFATNAAVLSVLAGDTALADAELTEADLKCAMKARMWLEQMRAYRLARGRPLFDVAQSEQAVNGDG
jgi:hypothetical protein